MSSRLSRLAFALAFVLGCFCAENVLAGPGPCTCDTDVNNVNGVNLVDIVIASDCARIGACGGCISGCDVNCDSNIDYYDAGVIACEFMGFSNCCSDPDGACTGADFNTPPCVVTTDDLCNVYGGTYHGNDTICVGNNAVDIPAASTWGLVVLALGTMIAATVISQRRLSTINAWTDRVK